MIEEHVSALLNVKSRVQALAVPVLPLDQPVELLSYSRRRGTDILPPQSRCATQGKTSTEKEQ